MHDMPGVTPVSVEMRVVPKDKNLNMEGLLGIRSHPLIFPQMRKQPQSGLPQALGENKAGTQVLWLPVQCLSRHLVMVSSIVVKRAGLGDRCLDSVSSRATGQLCDPE